VVPKVASAADAALAPIARPPTAIAAAAIVEKTFFNDMVSLYLSSFFVDYLEG